MKTFQLCGATLLGLALAVSAFAGHVDSPPVVQPPTSTTGTIDCPGVAATDTTTEVITTIVSVIY